MHPLQQDPSYAHQCFSFLEHRRFENTEQYVTGGQSFKDGWRLRYEHGPLVVVVVYMDQELNVWFECDGARISYEQLDRELHQHRSGFHGNMFPPEKLHDVIPRIARDIEENYTAVLDGDDAAWEEIAPLLAEKQEEHERRERNRLDPKLLIGLLVAAGSAPLLLFVAERDDADHATGPPPLGYVVEEVLGCEGLPQILEQELRAEQERVVLLVFHINRPGYNRELVDALKKLARHDRSRWKFRELDVEVNPQLAAACRIEELPTLLGMWRGEEVGRISGAPDRRTLGWFLGELNAVREAGLLEPEE